MTYFRPCTLSTLCWENVRITEDAQRNSYFWRRDNEIMFPRGHKCGCSGGTGDARPRREGSAIVRIQLAISFAKIA